MNNFHDSAAEAEAHYDHLDDLGQFDAATIREMTGYETDGSNEDFTAEAIKARTGDIALQGFMNTPETNQKGGLNHAALANNTPEQKAINAEGVAKARAAIAEATKEQ